MQKLIDDLNNEWFHIGSWQVSTLVLLKLIFLPILAILASRFFRKITKKLVHRSPSMDPGIRSAIVSVSYYLFLAGSLMWAMDSIGFDMASLTIFSGAVGVGVGLGLQDFAKNFIAGLLMMVTRPVKPGDRIEIGNLSGVVRSIGAYSTVLNSPDGSTILIPNSSLLNDRVINWSYSGAPRVVTVNLKLPVNSNVSTKLSQLMEAASEHPNVDKSFPPSARIVSTNEAAIEIQLSYTLDKGENNHQDVTSDILLKSLSD